VRARRKNRNGGFTLIELMISMALSTVGLLGLLGLQIISVRGNMMSRNFSEAIGIAQQQLEVATTTIYTSLSTLADLVPCTIAGTPQVVSGGTQNVSPDNFATSSQAIYDRCTTVVTNADNTTTVTVKVYWSDTSSNLHLVTLVTKRSP
jgi:prepilin-type N-terminal cleavage/methylation domain-containing protein